MTAAATAACPAWCTADHPAGGQHRSPEVLLDGAGALHVTAWLEAPCKETLRPLLRLESDGVAGSSPLDVARFAEAVAEWAQHLGYLAALASPADDAADSVLPAVLARAEAAWWQRTDDERAAWRYSSATARPQRHLTAVTAGGTQR
jgi:hypothetical protein